ncbi:hypothetical protein D3C81_1130700 [compost metagenome]
MEQADAQTVFQPAYLVAQRCLADTEFQGRAGEILVPGRGFEGAQGVERQGRVQHGQV